MRSRSKPLGMGLSAEVCHRDAVSAVIIQLCLKATGMVTSTLKTAIFPGGIVKYRKVGKKSCDVKKQTLETYSWN